MPAVATRTLRIGVALVAWAAMLGAALSIAHVPGDWGHSICGPWGCGPPLQALVACHSAWLVLLLPPAAILARSNRAPSPVVRQVGILLCVLAVAIIASVVIYQRLTWWPSVSEWQRGFIWQRCGFVLATAIDAPVAQVLHIGVYLTVSRRRLNVRYLTQRPLIPR